MATAGFTYRAALPLDVTAEQYPQYCPCLVPLAHLHPLFVQARFWRLPSSANSRRTSTVLVISESFLTLTSNAGASGQLLATRDVIGEL